VAKRHAALTGLSHDHHHTLALALRLRQGEGALLTDGWTHDPLQQIQRVQYFFESDLRPHFAAEEEILFPLAERSMPSLAHLIRALARQHREVENIIGLLKSAGGGDMRGLLARLGSLLEGHVRREERELFPVCESGLTEEALLRLGQEIQMIRERKS
jgi:iron-sulfur cluster repair protein YtfE (RIC family)